VNFQNNPSQFGSGLKTITATTSNSISYSETASNQTSLTEAGEVYKNYSTDASTYAWASLADSIPGPYVFDPIPVFLCASCYLFV
jgi:hypothetical protein